MLGNLGALKERLDNLKESYILRQPLNYVIQQEQRIDDLRKEEQNAPEIDLEAFKDAFKK